MVVEGGEYTFSLKETLPSSKDHPCSEEKIKTEFNRITESMVMFTISFMKKRANLMVLEGGREFKGVSWNKECLIQS